MNKFIIALVLIGLGFFYVLVLNSPRPSQKTKEAVNPPSKIRTSISPGPSAIKNLPTKAIIKTVKGDITLRLFPKDAPGTVANFAEKAKSGFYDNLIFHRVENWVIQGGDPNGNGTGGGPMPTELNNKPFVIGSLGVARGGNINISNNAQFFITKTDASWLNGKYTNFGIVTSGMDVVNKIKVGDKILGISVN